MKQDRKIFTKVFAYTMLLLGLMCLAAGGLFARQFLIFYRSEQHRQLSFVYESVISALTDKSPEEIAEIAKTFAGNNQSYQFYIQGEDGKVLFSTPGLQEAELPAPSPLPSIKRTEDAGGPLMLRVTAFTKKTGTEKDGGYTFIGFGSSPGVDYRDLVNRSLLALLFMIGIAVFGAILFAKKVTKPLEDEVIRERMMEENQRHFFSAASHELKTPIAATSALIEGMIANVGDYRDHPKYLRECLHMQSAQNRLVSEILEIVNLSDEKVEPVLMPLPLSELVSSVLSEYRAIAEGKTQTIEADISGVTVSADRNMLRRALSNVISNAVQNTPENETIHIWTGGETNGKIRLNILNPNARIDGEALQRLFEPFYRIDPARNRNASRSGLGLTIVKKVLDRMGVAFALENTGEGVLFWMDLAVI